MIEKIQKFTRNYLHKNSIHQDSYINKVKDTINRNYNIPSEEIETIVYAQISPFKVCEITFSEDIARDMRVTFENSKDYEVVKVENNQLEIKKKESVQGEIIKRKIGKIDIKSQRVYVDFIRENNGESLRASPNTEKILGIIDEYFTIKNK